MKEVINIFPGYLLFIVLCSIVIFSSRRLALRFFPDETLPSRAVLIVFVSLSAILVIVVGLGSFGHLSLIPVLTAVCLFGAVGLVAVRPAGKSPRTWDGRLTWMEIVVLVYILAYFGWFGITGLLFPPTGVDDLEFHLPFTAQAFQTGQLYPFLAPYIGPIYYPQSIETWYVWLLLPLRDDFLLNLGNFPFHILLVLSARQILREWGVSRNFAALSMPLWLHADRVADQAWPAHVDVPMAAVFLFGCLALVRYSKRKKFPDILLFAMSCGMVLGIKYSSVAYTSVLILAIIPLILIQRQGFRQVAKALAVILPITVLIGGYWYLRNILLTGTPLYPAGVSFFGIEIFPEGSLFYIKDVGRTALIYALFHRPGAFERLVAGLSTGILFWTVIFLPVSLLAPLDRSARNRTGRPPVPLSVYLLWALAWLTLLIYLFTPYTGPFSPESKLDIIYRGVRQGFVCWSLVLCGGIYWFDRRWPWPDGPAVALPERLRSKKTIAIIAAILILAVPLLYPNRAGNYYNRVYYRSKQWVPAWEWLDRNAPPGSVVSFTQMYLPYYNFGRKLDKTPVFISVNKVNGRSYHEFEGHGLRSIHNRPNYSSWLNNLKKNSVDFVHWGRRKKDKENRIEKKWLAEHPEAFEAIIDLEECKLYRVK